ncbi:MAG TPA: UDP-N-acetylmuramoyl-L-alanine--D-glutamate ligase [Candidatus Avilachnospira avistercoris]|nr:UDP-N-acetylmuramoyl-L-alanine--D-glutamate ligase [Candidatus Avilachnospira avistercoris]
MKNGRRIFVAGTGKSGIAAAKMVLQSGGEVVLYNSDPETDDLEVMSDFSPKDDIEFIKGKLYKSQIMGVSLAVVSPGIPLSAEFIGVLDKEQIPVIGELELAYQASKGRLCAVTGTNGKTTTTALIGEILKTYYKDVHVAGNIGEPFSAEALSTSDDSVSVVEVSSFMLETIMDFHPRVSAILNITPDHLDRHGTMENYIRCKEAITMNQTEDDYVVLNYDDPILREFGEKKELKPKVIWFCSGERPKKGEYLYLENDGIFLNDQKTVTELVDVHELKLLGKHNYENVMAAAAVGLKMGVPITDVVRALKDFKAVEHRIEFVRERSGVRYYNDSKGTNPDAAIQALRAMPGPVLLIGGGYDKHAEYDDWVKEFNGKVKYLILLGETRDKIADCCKKYGFSDIMYADDMDEAVKACASYADEGDYVLLSPACASWDMFKSYEERGEIFKDCVNKL